MDGSVQFEEILAAAEKMGIAVRAEPLGGEGGGLCRLRGQSVLFVDTMADVATRCQRALEALAQLPEIEGQYLRPDVRDEIDRIRAGKSSPPGRGGRQLS